MDREENRDLQEKKKESAIVIVTEIETAIEEIETATQTVTKEEEMTEIEKGTETVIGTAIEIGTEDPDGIRRNPYMSLFYSARSINHSNFIIIKL